MWPAAPRHAHLWPNTRPDKNHSKPAKNLARRHPRSTGQEAHALEVMSIVASPYLGTSFGPVTRDAGCAYAAMIAAANGAPPPPATTHPAEVILMSPSAAVGFFLSVPDCRVLGGWSG